MEFDFSFSAMYDDLQFMQTGYRRIKKIIYNKYFTYFPLLPVTLYTPGNFVNDRDIFRTQNSDVVSGCTGRRHASGHSIAISHLRVNDPASGRSGSSSHRLRDRFHVERSVIRHEANLRRCGDFQNQIFAHQADPRPLALLRAAASQNGRSQQFVRNFSSFGARHVLPDRLLGS